VRTSLKIFKLLGQKKACIVRNNYFIKLDSTQCLSPPILVSGHTFVGVIIVGMLVEDGLNENDQTLSCDIAAMLGANIYAKRLKQAAEKSSNVSIEMMHSMIPSKVTPAYITVIDATLVSKIFSTKWMPLITYLRLMEKMECFWDKSSTKYVSPHSATDCFGSGASTSLS